jgi:hypothetical protein
MRITEHALRKIIREELAVTYLNEVEVKPGEVQRRHTTALGNPAMKKRELEEEIKKAVLKTLSNIEGLGRQKFQYYGTFQDPAGNVDELHNIIVNVIPGKSWFVLEWPDMSLTADLKNTIGDELSKLWAVKAGEVSSANIDRLQTLAGHKYELTIDFPPSTEEKPAEDVIQYTVKKGDILAAIVTKFYNLPYSPKLFPLYRLLSNHFMLPKRPDPNTITPGDVLSLPAELKFKDRTVPRKTVA